MVFSQPTINCGARCQLSFQGLLRWMNLHSSADIDFCWCWYYSCSSCVKTKALAFFQSSLSCSVTTGSTHSMFSSSHNPTFQVCTLTSMCMCEPGCDISHLPGILLEDSLNLLVSLVTCQAVALTKWPVIFRPVEANLFCTHAQTACTESEWPRD